MTMVAWYPQRMSDSDSDSDADNLREQPTLPPRAPESSSVADQPTLAPRSAENPQTSAVPTLEGYEILGELGRGGMGVVYKARDTNLDRTVALKMVLGGKFASKEEIQRFRIEGEAAARLDHPGIVPIFDIGEADGNHFFSMKFIDGAALGDQIENYKNDNRKSAELMIKIARAVQHAHQRGVLHRDLKPANVLIDAEGSPSVTDLGLAKRMDTDSGLTQTGLIMGTPGFMAPEQATGQKDITTAADVFSLGAILYWLNTGEAPFVGETAVQTVMKTIEDETPSIRSRNKNADADLDLICQQAMNKDPLQRYNSAAALADDLQAWLDGELLSVRAPTALNVASLWVRKNLRTVLAACIAGAVCGIAVGMISMLSEMRGVAAQEYRIQQLGGSARTWVAPFVELRLLNDAWSMIEFLRVPIVAVCAFFCVLVVRPETREANIVAGVTAGLVAGVLTFLAGTGWSSLYQHSVQAGEHDVDLLSLAVWADTDQEQRLFQRALVQRYPGLETMDQSQKRKRIREKILHDQRTGLLPGTWFAAIMSLLFAGVPLAGTCVLSGMLWQQGERGFRWFGGTWERGAYLLVMLLMLSLWLRAIVPATHIMVISLAVTAFCLSLAVRQSSMLWRILVIPVPFVAMFWIVGDINLMLNCSRDAGRALNDVELKQKLTQCDRLLERDETPYVRYQTAVARLYLEDEEQYQFHCRRTLQDFEEAYTPGVGSRIAKVCMLRPDLQDATSLPLLHELSEYASSFKTADNYRWYCATRALVEVRRGNPTDAIAWNKKCRVDENKGDLASGYRHAQSRAVDALAYLDLADLKNAEKSLEIGRLNNSAARTNAIADGQDHGWVDWLVFQILEREAQSRLTN